MSSLLDSPNWFSTGNRIYAPDYWTLPQTWLEEADRDYMVENPLEDTEEMLDPSIIETGRAINIDGVGNLNPSNPNVSGIVFTSSPRTQTLSERTANQQTDRRTTRVLHVNPPIERNNRHNETILNNETDEIEDLEVYQSPQRILALYHITPFLRISHPNYEIIKDREQQIVDLYREVADTTSRRDALPDVEDPLYSMCNRNIEHTAELIERCRQERDKLIENNSSVSQQTNQRDRASIATPTIVTSTTAPQPTPTEAPRTNIHTARLQVVREELTRLTDLIQNLETAKAKTIPGADNYVSLNQLIIETEIRKNVLIDERQRILNEERNPPMSSTNIPRRPIDRPNRPTIPRSESTRPVSTETGPRQTNPIVMTEDLIVRMGETIAQAMRPVLSESFKSQTTTRPNKPVIQTVEKFNGELDKGLDWLEDFEVVANNNNWDNDEKARSAIYALNGPAKDWFKGTWREQHPHWHEFRTAFSDQYTPKGLQATLQNQLFSTQKRKEETYMDCYLRVRRLARRAFPEATPSDLIIYMARAVAGDRHYTMIANQSTLDGLQMTLRTIDTEVRTPFSTKI